MAPSELPTCGASFRASRAAIEDIEGAVVPVGLPAVVDAHVHLFPDRVFAAIWRWFEANGWPIRYPLHSDGVLAFLLSRGVSHVVGLHYAHKPGMAEALNRYQAQFVSHPSVTPLATVFPGEDDQVQILEEAFESGLRGVKLHCHVQAVAIDAPRVEPILSVAARRRLPVVVHAGREPSSSAYSVDPHSICAVERVARVLQRHPELTLVVPHLGADEFEGYLRLLSSFPNLYLDSTMLLAEYFECELDPLELVRQHPDRVLYGSDFPNLPYSWDRELRALAASGIPEQDLRAILGDNAKRVFQID